MLRLLSSVFCAASGCFAYTAALIVLKRLSAVRLSAKRLTLEDILCDRVLCFALFVSAGAAIGFAVDARAVAPCICIAVLLSRKAPGYVERRKDRVLRERCERQLDALSDTVAMGVRSGLNFDTALALYCNKFEGELAHEMEGALAQWQSGLASREQALMGLAQRIGSRDLERFCATVVQAVKLGSPMAQTLTMFSRDLRRARRVALEQRVERAPVKMLVPMGTCMLPAMLILVMGPVVLQFMDSGV